MVLAAAAMRSHIHAEVQRVLCGWLGRIDDQGVPAKVCLYDREFTNSYRCSNTQWTGLSGCAVDVLLLVHGIGSCLERPDCKGCPTARAITAAHSTGIEIYLKSKGNNRIVYRDPGVIIYGTAAVVIVKKVKLY
jgi:hypothetical protein